MPPPPPTSCWWNSQPRYSMPESPKYYDRLRRKWVAATPEERVRQWFIDLLAETAGVPDWMMMSEVPMKYGQKSWRADIVVYSGDGSPLAIVECKRPGVELGSAVAEQALRYSTVQQVAYIFLTNGTQTYAYGRTENGFEALAKIPTYQEMKEKCRH